MADLIQLRRDTAANWTAENPTLAQGEIGLELDTGLQKLGDGTTAWNSLAYHDTLPKTQSLTEINAALVDSDEIPVYDASATANRKSLLSRIWTYISGKLTTTANTFTANQIISDNSANAALRITQTGAGDCLRVEDAANPDSTPFVIDASGNVGIGIVENDTFDGIGISRPLVVQSSSSATTAGNSSNALVICNSDTTENNVSQLNFSAITGESQRQYTSAWIAAIHGARVNQQYPTGQLVFATSTAINQAPSEKMRITSAGNVLIATGTDNASGAKLQVAGAITAGDGSASLPSYSNADDPNTGIYFPAADTVGIAVGGADIARFSSNVLQLTKTTDIQVGASTIGWKDLTSDIQIRNNPATDPTWAQIGTSPFWAYRFDVGEKVWITFHINHDYYPGGQILLHTHWLSGGTNTTNTVKWQFTYSVMKGHNQTGGDLDTTGTVVSAETASGGQYRHMISEIASSITVTNAEVDSLICVVVERITNGATDNTDNIFLLTVDCHYQASRFATPQRAPNFYA